MSVPSWVTPLFQSIDNKDTNSFVAHLAEDVIFRFGNAAPVEGSTAVSSMIEPFFQAIAGLRHELIEGWENEGATIVRGDVCYTRHDGSTLEVPFINVLKRRGEKINEYLIYVDASQLFAG